MKVFYNNNFSGHWPVGTSAVIVASNQEEAKRMLEDQLSTEGLKQECDIDDFVEINSDAQSVIILQNGDY